MSTVSKIFDIPDIDERVTEVLRQSKNLDGICENTIQEINKNKECCRYMPGAAIYQDGDLVDHLYIVFVGKIQIIKQSSIGRNFIISMLHPGDCLNPLSFFGNGYVDVTAEALEPTTLIRLKHEAVLRILADDAELQPRIIYAGTERMRTVVDRLINMMTENAESRVYKLLVTLTSRYQETIPFTHHELADMLGVTRETVTRAISNLSSVGITHSNRGYVKIVDIEALKRIATSSVM